FSTYKLARDLFDDRLAAVIAVCCINFFPLCAGLSHLPLLDLAHLSLYSAAMLALTSWQRNPSWRNATILSVVLGFACTAKQVTSFFLIGPCACLFAISLVRRRTDQILQLIVAGVTATLFLLFWVIPNYGEIRAYVVRNAGLIGDKDV